MSFVKGKRVEIKQQTRLLDVQLYYRRIWKRRISIEEAVMARLVDWLYGLPWRRAQGVWMFPAPDRLTHVTDTLHGGTPVQLQGFLVIGLHEVYHTITLKPEAPR